MQPTRRDIYLITKKVPEHIAQGMRHRTAVWVSAIVLVACLAQVTYASSLRSEKAMRGSLSTDLSNLRAFFRAMNGANWRVNRNWAQDDNPCTWHGIHCVDHKLNKKVNRVTGISLPNNGLNGAIPDALWNLDRLEILWLPNNGLTGSLNANGLGNARVLKVLNLEGNKLTGAVPQSIGQVRNLRNLNLGQNQLTGMVPNSIGSLTQLTHLTLGGNKWDGAIPAEIGSLYNLRSLSIEDSNMGGFLPAELRFCTKLERVKLSGNKFEGVIPPEWGKLKKLQTLDVRNNRLDGAVEPPLVEMNSLKKVEFSGNALCFNNDTVVHFFTPKMADLAPGEKFPLCDMLRQAPEPTSSEYQQPRPVTPGPIFHKLCPKDGDRYFHCGGIDQCPGHYTYCRLKKPDEIVSQEAPPECPPKYAHCEPLVG